jgi:hypothetical protein
MTIHKTQGATMPSVVISLTTCFAPHTVYVAISRPVDIDLIYLIDFKESQIKVDPLVVEEMTRMRRNHITLQPKGPPPNVETTILMFNNTRSMYKHIDSLRSSSTLKHATMLILQETFLEPGDDSQQYNINHLCVRDRVDTVTNNSSRRHGCTVVLNTENTHSYPILYYALNGNEYIIARTPSFTMISVYKPPHQSLSTVTQDLQNMLHFIPHDSTSRTILLGDLNSDILQLSRELKPFQQQMANSLGLHPVIEQETTNYHSCLDHIYCNFIPNASGVQETFWSDHTITWVQF